LTDNPVDDFIGDLMDDSSSEYEENEINFITAVVSPGQGPTGNGSSNGMIYSQRPERDGSASPESRFFNKLKVLSFSIRIETDLAHGVSEEVEKDEDASPWSTRRELVLQLLLSCKSDIICLQNVMEHQIEDLSAVLSPKYEGWNHAIISEKDKDTKSLAILYNVNKLKMMESGTFTMSDFVGTVQSDSVKPMKMMWMKLCHVKAGMNVFVVDVHMHMNQPRDTRLKCIFALMAKLRTITKDDRDARIILAGDLGCTPESPEIELLLKNDELHDTATRPSLNDSPIDYTYVYMKNGSSIGTDIAKPEPLKECKRIDYIFHNSRVQLLRFRVLNQISSATNGTKLEHLPISAEFYF
jgi:endonuclease/exonuclease/phosphatase family metal-dependent hydrolase